MTYGKDGRAFAGSTLIQKQVFHGSVGSLILPLQNVMQYQV